jgi:hypothetical protein
VITARSRPRIERGGSVRNSNDRSNERGRESTASAERDTRAAAAQMVDGFQARVDKLYDRAREVVQAQLQAAGADRSPLAETATQRLDAMRTEQSARVRDAAAAAVEKGAEQAVDPSRDLKKTEDALNSVMTQLINESLRVRDALTQEIGTYKDRRADATVDHVQVAALEDRVKEALERNRKQQSAIESIREGAQKERNEAGTDAQRRAALERDIPKLDQRIDAYRARAEAIADVSKLLERGRVDLAERFLDAVKRADGSGKRRAQDPDVDKKRVNELREMDTARSTTEQATRFAVLDRKFSDVKPVRELWERAAAVAKENPALVKRDLYNRAMDEFKKLLIDQKDETARQARALFEKDGFRFAVDQRGEMERKLPMLNDPDVESRLDMARHADLLRISGQHLTKIEDNGDPVAADNLSFMIARDNMQMDVQGELSEYVRQKVVERMKAEGVDDDEDA